MHLFVSFMLRAVSIFLKDLVVDASGGMQQYDAVLMDDINVVSIGSLDKTQYVSVWWMLALLSDWSNSSAVVWYKKNTN